VRGNPNPSPETRFSKGQSGNPGGRPKGRSCAAMLRDILDEEAKLKDRPAGHGISVRELLMRKLVDQATKTMDPALLRIIFERSDGKVPDRIETTISAVSQDGIDLELDAALRAMGYVRDERRKPEDPDGLP
jgi:hypothetical protein